MTELLTGSLLTLISLLVGFQLGRHDSPVSPDTAKRIGQILKRVAPPAKPDAGIIERPTQQQNFYRDNPQVAEEHKLMRREFDTLEKKPL